MTPPAQTQTEQNSRNTWQGRLGQGEALKLVALVVVFTLPAFLFLRNFFMSDPDFGWHLRAARMDIVPPRGSLHRSFLCLRADKPWYDYSWLFDICFALIYRAFGLRDLRCLKLRSRAIPAFIFAWPKLELAFWPAALCTTLAAFSISSIYPPRPGWSRFYFSQLSWNFC